MQLGGPILPPVPPAPPAATGGAAVVANNIALATSKASAYPNGVTRNDYSPNLGAPPQFYNASATPCTLNAGAGDGGSQVASSDGGCFNAVFPTYGADLREWGVQFDNGTADNSATLLNAVAYGAATGPLAVPGTNRWAGYSTAITVTLGNATQKFTMRGTAFDQSMIGFTGVGGDALAITYFNSTTAKNSVNLTDFSFCTTRANASNGIHLAQGATVGTGALPVGDVRVTFRGCDGWNLADYFAIALHLTGVFGINFNETQFQGANNAAGVGVAIDGGSASSLPALYNFSHITASNYGSVIQAGANVQGVTITGGSNFTNVGAAMTMNSAAGVDEIIVADSQIECVAICLNLEGADIFVHDTYFIFNASNAIGIYIPSGNRYSLHHNHYFNGASFTGLIADRVDQVTPTGAGQITNNIYSFVAVTHQYGAPGSQNFVDNVSGNVYENGTGGPALGTSVTVLLDTPVPFANVPACSAALLGREQQFTNSTVNTFGATIAGGGAFGVKGRCNGTNWTVEAI